MNLLDRLAGRPEIAINAGLALVLAAGLAYQEHFIASHHGSWPFDLAVGVVICAAALLRGRWPGWAAAVGLAVAAAAELAAWLWHLPAQPDGPADLALLVLIGSAVRVLPWRQAVPIVAGGAVVAVGSIERYLVFIERGTPDSFAATRLMIEGLAFAVGIGLWLRLLDVRRAAAFEAVRRGERLELARELHDHAAHHVTGIVLQAQAARVAARSHPERLDEALAGIESVGTAALNSMRQVIGLLRDPDDAGGVSAGAEELTDLVDRFAGRGSAVQLRLPDGPADPGWPPELATTVNRIVAEALTNVTRHAPDASAVAVTLAHDREAITVEVTDDAPAAGARFPHASGYGLAGMRERVEALGGTLSAGPRPAAGWAVRATLPAPGRS
jgi:signal transduction histidine kinase